jgi:copper(I)-binding protein
MRLLARNLVALSLLVFASSCSRKEAPSGAAAAGEELSIQDAVARLAPGAGAIYLKVVNPTAEDDRLLGITSPAAEAVEMHEVKTEGDVMRMVPHPEGFAVPAHGTLELKPGGKHLMLMGLKPVKAGQEIRAELEFQRAGRLSFGARVVDATAGE